VNILGIAFLSDASACVLRNGRLVAAVSEERLNRTKLWNGIPRQAIDIVLRIAGISLDEVDLIATHGAAPSEPDTTAFEEKERAILAADLQPDRRETQLAGLRSRHEHERAVLSTRTPRYLADIVALGRPVHTVPHHEAHAASAYYGSGWDECLVVTADGWGEDASSTFWVGHDGAMRRIGRSYSIDSLGYFYGSITKSLGFVPQRHEGKVLGLSASCEHPQSYSLVRSMVDYDPVVRRFVGRMERGLYLPRFENPALQQALKGYSREDVAAATQRTLEEVVCAGILDVDAPRSRIGLAGGIFNNVRLNQRIRELPGVEDVYVFPNMGDGGLSVGAAWLAHVHATSDRPDRPPHMYLGPDASESEIADALAASGLPHTHCPDINERVGSVLADNHVVARFGGAMEFGPRALGNRSILGPAVDPGINEWLNQRLHRSEFMPFAPATLADAANSCYIGLASGRMPAQYMTMTFSCTDLMRQEAPAAVHLDGTARPQIVSREDNPGFHRILERYRQLTGRSSVVNTSFNMHEEPIVCSIDDALRAFMASQLPYLAAGPFLVTGDRELLT
jgi:carbamoyltransferase